MIQRGIGGSIDEEKWEAVMAARKDLLEGEAALASWRLARENAAREAEDAKRAAQGGGKTPGKAVGAGSGGVPPTGNAPPHAGTNARKGSRTDRVEMEEAEKSGDGNGVQETPVGLWALGAAIVIDVLLKQKTPKGARSSAAKEAGQGPPRATVGHKAPTKERMPTQSAGVPPAEGVSQGVKGGDDASGDDSPLMPPVSSCHAPVLLINAPLQKKKRKLPAPRDDKEEGPDTPRTKRRLRRSTIKTEAKARIVTSPDIQEDARSVDIDLAREAEEEYDGEPPHGNATKAHEACSRQRRPQLACLDLSLLSQGVSPPRAIMGW